MQSTKVESLINVINEGIVIYVNYDYLAKAFILISVTDERIGNLNSRKKIFHTQIFEKMKKFF